jgi:predicted dehydrogenase
MTQKHSVLIVGVGSIGERHLRCFQTTGRANVGLVEVNPTLRQTIADRYKVADVFDSLDAAAGSGIFTAALIATPAQFHVSQATQTIKAGLHTLIEKPLSTSTDGIDGLLQAANANKQIVVGVAYTHRSISALGGVRETLLSGEFGTPIQVIVNAGQNVPFYRPAYRDIYYKDRKTGGGAIQDALTHMVNAVEWLVGPMTQVIADAKHLHLEGVSVEDTVHLLARHNNVMASYQLNQYQYPNETYIQVNCTKGTVRYEAHAGRFVTWSAPSQPGKEHTYPPAERDTAYINQANKFLDAIEGKAPFVCSLEEGLQTLKVNLAILGCADSPAWKQV